MYKVGDKIQIKTWEELKNEFEVKYYELVDTEAVRLPDGCDTSQQQLDKIASRCENRIDTIRRVDEFRGWYYLEKSKTIVTKYVIKYKVIDTMDEINNRFEILDL